jgi:hypothetical protein
LVYFLTNPLRLAESDADLNALNVMLENAIAFFYPGESSTRKHAPQMLHCLPRRSCEIILTNMKQSASLTLGILKSQYPRADLEVAGEGFTVTCSDEEALKLIEDSAMMAGHIIDMLPVDMCLG